MKKIIKQKSLWSELKKIEEIRFVKTMYIWLILVPLLAKVFSSLEDSLSFNIDEKSHVLDLTLPFHWEMMFFAALLFSIGNALYSFFCPRIVKENRDFGEFQSSGKMVTHLESYIGNNMNDYSAWILTRNNTKDLETEVAKQFWKMHKAGDGKFPKIRYLVLV